MATSLPPRKNNSTPSRISKEQTALSILLQMGFSKHRAEKAIAATGNRGVQLASDWLLAHVNDATIDDCEPREYILYVCPSGKFMKQLEEFWDKTKNICGWNGAHNYIPHITLVSFFKAPDECAPQLSKALKDIVELAGSQLEQHMSLELYVSHNFIGFFVTDDDANYLKRLALQYVKEVSGSIISDTYEQLDALVTCFPWCGGVSNTQCIPRSNRSISLEPHVKSLHLTLAYQFPSNQFDTLQSLVEKLDPICTSNWELRLYSRDTKISSKQVRSVLYPYNSREPDELELRIGDYIYVSNDALQNSTDGWVEGSSWLTGASGYFPESYTRRTAESDAWTIHETVPLSKCIGPSISSLDTDTVDGSVDSGDSMINHQLMYLHDAAKSALFDLSNSNNSNASVSNDENVKCRRIYIARHGERVDFTFGRWIPHCFDAGKYTRKDLNMPKHLPDRINGPDTWLLDSPITNIGMCQAKLTGDAMKDAGVDISFAYSSPSYRCVQTCHGILEGLGMTHIKIRIEFALFEWMAWYQDKVPEWCTKDELFADNFNIDMDYESFMTKEDLQHSTKETAEQFYRRNHSAVEHFLQHNESGNVLMVGHACTLDSCSRLLIGRNARTQEELSHLLQKVPYCSTIVIEQSPSDNEWHLKDPCCFPVTHNKNTRFDWTAIDN
ncbi:protein UBASH3A homolog isoform X1 [Bradysia coprophila]|uniref:protein UBASH3A homolog isoform X1 n=1 Tax=Bradysia coprophila TaxID=38358 RepID=UPI00187DB430|nr:protein UBASH3A homolog isoform X1 [Bradysia coprophila]